jgi:hypothetical protein
MKYLLTSIKPNHNTQLSLENVIPAKTGHIKGYGSGVTFTSKGVNWKQSASITSLKMLEYSAPTVITQ